MKIVNFSLNRPVTVIMLVVSIVLLGAVSITRLPQEMLPQMDFPFIGVVVAYPNSIPSQVEEEITRPIEEVCATMGGMKEMFSDSGSDYCFVGMVFNWGQSVDVLRMGVREKIDQIRDELPSDIQQIDIFTFNSNDMPIMVGRIAAPGMDLSGSYEVLNRKLIAPLERINGVGQVNIDGVEPKTISIYLHLDKIKSLQVDVNRIFQVLGETNLTLSVGKLEDGGTRYHLRAFSAMEAPQDLARIPIRQDGLQLGDVATVIYDEPLLTYGRHLNQEPAIAFWIQKESGANVVELCHNVHKRMEELKEDPALAGMDILLFFDQSEQITNSINGLLQAGFVGSLLAVLVLYLFLRRLITTLLVAIAIPFSLIGTCTFLYLTGRTLNILTMMGLMLAVGMMVDNAVVVLESIHRHQGKERDPRKAAIKGASEVGMAVTAATLTSIIVFAPITFSNAQSGLTNYLAVVGITISSCLVFSLLVSLILIPLMASKIPPPKSNGEVRWITALKKRYKIALNWAALKHPKIMGLLIVPAVLALTILVAKVGGIESDPEADVQQENLYISYKFTDNMTYTLTEPLVFQVEDSLLAHKQELEIEQVYSWFADNGAATTIYFNDKTLKPKQLIDIRNRVREVLPTLAGVELNLGGNEESNISGATFMQVTIFGEDHTALSEIATEVKRRFELVDGMYDITSDDVQGKQEIRLRFDPEKAGQYKVNPSFIAQLLNLTFRGAPLPDFKSDDGEIPMSILLTPEDRTNIENLLDLPISIIEGREVTLAAVADLDIVRGPEQISRSNQRTSLTISGTYESEDSEKMKEITRGIMDNIQYPTGYGWNFGRSIQDAEEDQTTMLINTLLALVSVGLVMAALFQSFLHPIVIMVSLPFAFIGVVLILLLTGTPFSIMVSIGGIILIGVVVNNGIVLVDHINGLRREGLSRAEAIIEGGQGRLRPILMTAATTILGLLPLAVGTVSVGDVLYKGLALAVIGGLGLSTLLTLLVMPTYYVLAEEITAHLKKIWHASRRSPLRRLPSRPAWLKAKG
ncbi:MAG: efflux RND transporter permease subunit [Candidatus Eisenbacteria bacterium]|uniref:Efflux RND transporter permease subunit n=1 Tax=Eiseniibacteriota bacterium TaxID=2212470 RepID=A0A948S2F8_UNCEI|nr:efflux RND transporter permease subunit [Candidatus Eisenbacteria bacterium]MBU1950587.1 efflux RND transporter permease subunit [Candidatus Eisenbacteria bacterium]MBU2692614.1 efflux RND transporter permease subunit [Candidatus Eisenbacteria bacterium]